MRELGDALLLVHEVLRVAGVIVAGRVAHVRDEGRDKFEKAIHGIQIGKRVVVLGDAVDEGQRHLLAHAEIQEVQQQRVVLHLEDSHRQRLDRACEQVRHPLGRAAQVSSNGMPPKHVHGGAQNEVHIMDLAGVQGVGEGHESRLNLQARAQVGRGGGRGGPAARRGGGQRALENVVEVRPKEAENVRAGEHVLPTLRLGEVVREAGHQSHHNGFHVDRRLRLRVGGQQLLQSVQMELVAEDLDHAFEEVLLRHCILDGDYVVKDFGQRLIGVVFQTHSVELAQAHQVGPDQDAQVVALLLALGLVPQRPLALDPHPQPVALHEIAEDGVERVVHVAPLALVAGAHVWHLVFHHLRDVVPQEKASQWMLHAFAELPDVLQNLLRRSFLGFDVR
mmetsp:Transcript_81856/g.250128  ORF Transcript_81856/g.250128 Transcript_81856/m.250128 type:complete len:393 (-) Transcript_81856:389-1567(-)